MKEEDYLQERKLLFDAKLQESLQCDKYLLTLASGAFGLSLAFMQQIAPQPVEGSVPLLIVGWTGFGLSILLTLLSFLFSQQACERQTEILDTIRQKRKPSVSELRNTYANLTLYLNWISMLLFVIGLAFLMWFSISNIGG
jgi:hypothetical protein